MSRCSGVTASPKDVAALRISFNLFNNSIRALNTTMTKGSYLAEFEQVVLLALARTGTDAYGMTIYDEIHKTTGRASSIPSVYVTLARMEEKGYVSSHTGEPTATRGGRAKKYYRLEASGAEALRRSRTLLDQLWNGVDLGVQEPHS